MAISPIHQRLVAPLVAIYGIAVAVAIVLAYPRLVTEPGGHDFRARPAEPEVHRSVRGPAATTVSGPATFEYRLNGARTGVGDEPFDAVAATPSWTFRPLNVGIHDASKSSPAVDDTGVYVGADSSWFYALDLGGKLRWKFRVGDAARGIHATAALDASFVYIGAYNGTLYALRKTDGELGWALRLGDTIGSSVAIDGDSLYVSVETFEPPDGFVARIKRSTGEVVWRSSWLGEQSHSSPTIDLADGLVLAGSNNGIYRALRLDTGAEVWRVPTRGGVKDTGTLVDGIVYFTSIEGALYAVRAVDGHVVWQTTLTGHTRSSPTFVPGVEASSPPSILGPSVGKLIIGTDDGSVLAVEAATGQLAWRSPTGFTNMIASALALRGRDGSWNAWMSCGPTALCAFRATTGEVVQRIELAASITNVPTIFRGSLYVATDLPGGLVRLDR